MIFMILNDFIFLCVGDSTVLFDSLGAVVADFLRIKKLPALVIGGATNPITTKNIKIAVETLRKNYANKKILVIDCTCKEKNENVGYLNQKIVLKKGKVNIANINYECGDYNILVETFEYKNNKISCVNYSELLQLSGRVLGCISENFKN